MKKTVINAALVLVATLLIALMPTEAEAEIYEDTLRLHILAEDDSEAAQALKLEIRDRLLTEYGTRLSSSGDVDAAIENAVGLLPEIEASCERWCCELASPADVTVTLREEWYDTREYEGFTLPRGYYRSLRVVIGEGMGRNWWCVMYPPLCLGMATEDAPADDGVIDYTREEIALIESHGYQVKFKLLEIISEAFKKNS
jgi:stage II sporulation protein R